MRTILTLILILIPPPCAEASAKSIDKKLTVYPDMLHAPLCELEAPPPPKPEV